MKNNGDLPDEEAMEVDEVCDSSKNDLKDIEGNSVEEDTEDGSGLVEHNETNSAEENTEDESSVVENNAEVSSSLDENSQEPAEENSDVNESETASDTEEHVNQEIDKQSAAEDDEESSVKDNEDPLGSESVNANEGTIELNDSGEDIMIVDSDAPKENGNVNDSSLKIINAETVSDDTEVITLDTPVKKKKHGVVITQSSPRRSSRNLNKQKSYVESDKEEEEEVRQNSEESDIEEVLPQDPLAVSDPLQSEKRKGHSTSSAIVVKDTKRLVEIASKSNPSSAGGKKEPTLVIIDTNSILSGRGPVPLVTSTPQPKPLPKQQLPSSKPAMPSFPMLPMALPAQGIYPPNMRATITPIPINTAPSAPPKQIAPPTPPPPPVPVLPTLTDDMFVVEAPSFIVPYVYEKPPLKDFKGFVKDIQEKLAELRKQEELEAAEKDKDDKSDTESDETKEKETEKSSAEKKDDDEADKEKAETREGEKSEEKKELGEADEPESGGETKKPYSYFDSPLGKFFIDIGTSLVQEFVQADLLKQQKRKRDREGITTIFYFI